MIRYYYANRIRLLVQSTVVNFLALMMLASIQVQELNAQRLPANRQSKSLPNPTTKPESAPKQTQQPRHTPKPFADENAQFEFWVDMQNPAASDQNFGTQEAPFRSILAAVRTAMRELANDTAIINIQPGIYRETILIPPHKGEGTLILRGLDVHRVVISGADLMTEWEPAPEICPECYTHINLIPDNRAPPAFYVGKTPQFFQKGKIVPDIGHFTLRDGKILWHADPKITWRRIDISLPTRPYSEEGSEALLSIPAAKVSLKNLTIMHTTSQSSVISVGPTSHLDMHNVHIVENHSLAIRALAHNGSSSSTPRILIEHCHLSDNSAGTFRISGTDLTIRQSTIVAESQRADTHYSAPVIVADHSSRVQIINSLIALYGQTTLLDISSTLNTVLRNNIIYLGDQRSQIVFNGPGRIGIHANTFLAEDDSLLIFTINRADHPLWLMKSLGPQGIAARQHPASLALSANSFQSNILFVLLDSPLVFPPEPPQPTVSSPVGEHWIFTGNCLAPGLTARLTRTNRSIHQNDADQNLAGFVEQLFSTPACPPQPLEQLRQRTKEKLRLLAR